MVLEARCHARRVGVIRSCLRPRGGFRQFETTMGSLRLEHLLCTAKSMVAVRTLVTLSLLFVAAPLQHAAAQGAVRSLHNDWQVRCDTPPGAQGEQCALMQSVTAEDRANVGLTVIVLKAGDHKSRLMPAVAPVGVLLPSGLGLKIEQVAVGRAGFVGWLPDGCVCTVGMDVCWV